MDVTIEGLRFERDGRVVLDIPSLVLCGDRTTAVLGPNGAGKTTLLRLIAGLERPASGRVLIGDEAVRPRRRADVSFVFQEQVFLSQTVRENLDLGLRLRGLRKEERASRVASAAALVGISHLLDRRADRLSGGEGRRASLARALCLRSPVALLDEPLAGLDPPTYVRLRDDLPGLLRAFGATTLLVTHDHREAMWLAEQLVVLVDGRVEAAGEKSAVISNPRCASVARMLGYAIIDSEGRRLAIRDGTLKIGEGAVTFRMTVDHVLEFADEAEIAGSIGTANVRVRVWATDLPSVGASVLGHADRVCEVE